MLFFGGIVRFRIAAVGLAVLAMGFGAVSAQAAQDDATIAAAMSAIADGKLRAAMLDADRGEVLSLIVPADAASALGRIGFDIGDQVGSLPFRSAKATLEEMAEATRGGLAAGVSLNQIVPSLRPVNVPDWLRPLLMDASTLTGASRLHAEGWLGTGTSVAIIDSGIQASHPYFRDASGRSRVVAESCFVDLQVFTNAELPCPGGQNSVIGPAAADIGSDERFGHGTHVAGIAAGNASQAPGASGYTGMAPEANLVVSRVFGTWGALDSDITAAMDWVASVAATHKIASVNLSLGSYQARYFDCRAFTDSIYGAVTAKLRAAGVAIVAASGNNGGLIGIGSPACAEGWVAVGATDQLSRVASFSNVSEELDVLAPGVNIWSALPGDNFNAMSGTSMSAPVVAGAFALLRQAEPAVPVDAALDAMRSTGPRVNDVIVKNLSTLRVDMTLNQLAGSSEVLPVAPSPPLNVSVQPLDKALRIAWSVPSSDGGSPITGYFAEVQPAGSLCIPSSGTSCIVGGLTNGTAYRVSVYARNAFGSSSPTQTGQVRPSNDVPVPPQPQPEPKPRPGKVTDLSAKALKTAVRFSWRAPELAAGQAPVSYEYRVGRSIPKPTQMLSVRVQGKKGVPIRLSVRPVSKTGPGPWLSITGTPR